MQSRHSMLSVLAILVALCSGQSDAKPKIDTVVYQVQMNSPQGNMGTRKMYKKGDNFVWEADSAGIKMKFIKNKDGAFMLHPMGRFAGKYPPGTNRESPMTFLPGPAGDVKQFLDKNEAKKEGEEKIDKTLCDIYTYTEKETKWKCKLWVEQKTLRPVKMVMTGAKKSDTIDVTYISYRTGAVVADSRFELPKGLEIRPMPEKKDPPKTEGEPQQDKSDASPAEPADKQ